MTAQKKEVPRNTENQQRQADSHGWIEVKRNKDKDNNNKSSPRQEPKVKAVATKKNKFDMFSEPSKEKAPKPKAAPQKVAQTKQKNASPTTQSKSKSASPPTQAKSKSNPAPQAKSKSASPPKQKTAPAQSAKVEETHKTKKNQEPKTPPKTKPAPAVSAKDSKPAKAEKPAKSSPPTSAKATVQKEGKKTSGKGKKSSAVGDLCKQMLHWLGFSLIIVGIIGSAALAYQQHRSVLDQTIAQHQLEISDLKTRFQKDIWNYQQKEELSMAAVEKTREEMQKFKQQIEKDNEAKTQMDMQIKKLKKEVTDNLQALLEAKEKSKKLELQIAELKK